MKATIVIRNRRIGSHVGAQPGIVALFDVDSIDERTVADAVRNLRDAYPGHEIDTSQVDLARQAMQPVSVAA